MALENDIFFLGKIETFRALGPDALRVLAISAEKIHLRAGDVLFEEGEPADAAYVIGAGSVRLRRAIDKVVNDHALVEEGALIGESALMVETVRPASAIAVQPSMLFKITRGVFLRMLESDVGAAMGLREIIARRVNSALSELDTVLPRLDPKL